MKIRKANYLDCDSFIKLRIEMQLERDHNFNDKQNDFVENTRQFFIENINKSFTVFVAEDNVEIIAMGGIVVYNVPPTPYNPSGKLASLLGMFTKPQHRNKGIATRLLSNLAEEARLLGCEKISLNATQLGKSIYKKYGFYETEGHMSFYFRL